MKMRAALAVAALSISSTDGVATTHFSQWDGGTSNHLFFRDFAAHSDVECLAAASAAIGDAKVNIETTEHKSFIFRRARNRINWLLAVSENRGAWHASECFDFPDQGYRGFSHPLIHEHPESDVVLPYLLGENAVFYMCENLGGRALPYVYDSCVNFKNYPISIDGDSSNWIDQVEPWTLLAPHDSVSLHGSFRRINSGNVGLVGLHQCSIKQSGCDYGERHHEPLGNAIEQTKTQSEPWPPYWLIPIAALVGIVSALVYCIGQLSVWLVSRGSEKR
ncbi:MAG: hypothetical protein JJT95_09670 [Pararhodobacter sp.]|nr:hypothetical protein [Pararhodobacter sp.]